MSSKALLIRLINVWALFGGVLLLVIVGVTAINAIGFTANTVSRFWGGSVSGLPGYEDAVQMIVGVAALVMFPYAQLHRSHASVDLVMSRAPLWINRIVTVASSLVLAALLIWMSWMLFQGTLQTRSDQVESTVLAWPVWVFMPFAVISCLLWAAAAVLNIAEPETSDGT